ncbi:hypothetical protein BKA70DRAFT_1259896 [Coprinopsis sp. MPI-PUGE-AT-0042]|nr:hypothetical protein BKA70DRAFT_1259896 [Coprinopsis sp. MPI-PUGE-AT-0042]
MHPMYIDRSVVIVQEPDQMSPASPCFDVDLCSLLQTMNIDEKRAQVESEYDSRLLERSVQDDLMMEDHQYHSDGVSVCSDSSSSTDQGETYYGCAYLQAIRGQIESFQTTSGEYLETIFTHREILASHPAAHRDCARAFSDIAYVLEKRGWRSDRESDSEAVSTFRHEAWTVANSL